jgi:hypothetical protein
MRVLLDDAREESLRELTVDEAATLRVAVLGAHSAIETSLENMPAPSRENRLAYGLQASVFFRRSPVLEEMARHRELLRLMISDERLMASANRVSVDGWLAASGMTAEEQWAVGFGLSAMTSAFGESIRARVLASHLDELLVKLGLDEKSRQVPVISASRGEFQQRFAMLGGGRDAFGWELRPFKTAPFLRLEGGDLLLLGVPWLQSWLGEGFHYRAMTHAQRKLSQSEQLRYTRFVGEAVERYALDLAQAAVKSPARVIGEQRYGKGGEKRTSDVAIVSGADLILFEVHARRVAAGVAVTGITAEATAEVSKLLVKKVDQLGACVGALLDGTAVLPDVDLGEVQRVWPVVVSAGHLMQTRDLWGYLRDSIDPVKTRSLGRGKVQHLQLLDLEDYEKLLGIVEAGQTLPAMLARKAAGPFRERDFAAWLHGDTAAPSDQPRLSLLEARWEEMSDQVLRMSALAATPSSESGDGGK